ncbi:hypothetical protein [Pseudovibrio brasiliensis]|uniref:Lipoprotein n=1 Tax=Pseudovibrio brasiliensis TaxID=1898042 RepID=A0ABX8AHL3_9HYPH|nr:hypothetical protein [Pseudovibrio brasiliensis]QUS54560.1 hypothetical protein KGB56_14295 [Pseudovibrio brasiliensis]
MFRIWIIALMLCVGLSACSSNDSPKVDLKAQLKTPEPSQYKEIVTAFINQCVKRNSTPKTTSDLYVIARYRTSCVLVTDTHYDDDTVIAKILNKELKRTDPRFVRMSKGGLMGATWKIGQGTSWSSQDGTPLVSLGRSSAQDVLGIRRNGNPL